MQSGRSSAGLAPREPESLLCLWAEKKSANWRAIECEGIAANLANKGESFRRIHLDLAAKWREKAAAIDAKRRRNEESRRFIAKPIIPPVCSSRTGATTALQIMSDKARWAPCAVIQPQCSARVK